MHVSLNFAWNDETEYSSDLSTYPLRRVCECILITIYVQQVHSVATIILSWLQNMKLSSSLDRATTSVFAH